MGREAEKKGATMQPKELWAFPEKTTRAALILARSWLQEPMMTMQQIAGESLELYIACNKLNRNFA